MKEFFIFVSNSDDKGNMEANKLSSNLEVIRGYLEEIRELLAKLRMIHSAASEEEESVDVESDSSSEPEIKQITSLADSLCLEDESY